MVTPSGLKGDLLTDSVWLMITKNDKRLGKTIRRFRRKQNLTQEQLAEMVGVTPKYIQYLEAAKRKPSLDTLYRTAKALKIKVKDLFTF